MRLRFKVYEANVRGSPVEFSFSSSRTERAERGVGRERCTTSEENEEKFGTRHNASSGSYGGGMIYLRKIEELAGGRGGTRGAAGPDTNALYS